MNIIFNLLVAGVITCFGMQFYHDPINSLENLQYHTNLTYTMLSAIMKPAMTFDTIIKLGLFLLSFLYPPWIVARKMNRLTFNGRQLIAQSLSATAMSVPDSNQETNQDVNSGASNQVTTSLQTQVAPNLKQDILLPNAKLAAHYSTPMYVGQFTFSTTNTIGQNIAFIGSNMLYGNNNMKRLFIDKRFARFDLRFTINITGNPFATGLLAFANIPCPNVPPATAASQDSNINIDWTDYYNRVIGVNHVIADMSVDGVYRIDMPYTNYASYLSFDGYTSNLEYAAIVGTVISPYLAPTGSTTAINFEVYATIINLETIETAPYNAQSLISIGETTNITNKLDNIQNANLPTNLTGDTISASVPAEVGLDNPPDPRNVQASFLRMAYQKLISWTNVVDVFKTTQTPQTVADFTEDMSQELKLGIDEMSMDFFRGRYFNPIQNTYSNFSISTAAPTGQRLISFPILPFNPCNDTTDNTDPTTNFSTWLCSFFRYWRGSMKYRILLASNNFKRGKLLIAVNYGGGLLTFPPDLVSGQIDPRSLPHIIVDLSNADRIIDIEIPYKSQFEYLRIAGIQNNYTAPQTTMQFNERCMGTIGIYLVSPLQVSNGTATTVNFNILQAWGDDFELYDRVQGSPSAYNAQSQLSILPEPILDTRSHMMIPFRNIKQLLTRPTHIGTFNVLTGLPTYPNPPIIIPIHPIFLGDDAVWSGICAAYCGIRGGYRLIVRIADVVKSQSVRIQYFENFVPYSSSGAIATLAAYPAYAYASTLQSNTVSLTQPYANPPIYINPVGVNRSPRVTNLNTNVAGNSWVQGNPSFDQIIADPYNQPEVIVEIPDPSPMYRTQQSLVVPVTQNGVQYPLGDTGKYNPLHDRNIGWLVINTVDAFDLGTRVAGEVKATVEVSLAAADDFRSYWYNGGPTSTKMFSNVTVVGTVPIYSNLYGK